MALLQLCPVYQKWLQLNPCQAREHILTNRHNARAAMESGNVQTAHTLLGEAFEIAHCLMNRLATPGESPSPVIQDAVLYALCALSFSRCSEQLNLTDSQATSCLHIACQKIRAVAPLFAADTTIVSQLAGIEHGLQKVATAEHFVSSGMH